LGSGGKEGRDAAVRRGKRGGVELRKGRGLFMCVPKGGGRGDGSSHSIRPGKI